MKQEITLVGYGNQGKAWAANLRDSGWDVRVSGRPDGGGMQAARNDGFALLAPEELHAATGLVALLLPDEAIPSFFEKYFTKGKNRSFLFAHGFSVVYGKLPFAATDDVILLAPKGIGTKLRERYVAGSGVLGVIGVAQDFSGAAWEKARFVSKGLGLDRVGILESTFLEETKTDLLSEQAILCGAVPRLVEETVKFLVNKGVNPELATYECLSELKLIVDMITTHGIHGMLKKVSTAAKFGGMTAAEVILPEAHLHSSLEKLWQEIESGSFAQSLAADGTAGYPVLQAKLKHFETSLADKHREKL